MKLLMCQPAQVSCLAFSSKAAAEGPPQVSRDDDSTSSCSSQCSDLSAGRQNADSEGIALLGWPVQASLGMCLAGDGTAAALAASAGEARFCRS